MAKGKFRSIPKLTKCCWLGETGSWCFGLRARSGAVHGSTGHGKTPQEAKDDYDHKLILQMRKELKA